MLMPFVLLLTLIFDFSIFQVVKFAFSVYTLMKQMDFGQEIKDSVTGEKKN